MTYLRMTICVLLGFLAGTALAKDIDLPTAKPEAVGMSSDRLARIAPTMEAYIAMSGKVTVPIWIAVWRPLLLTCHHQPCSSDLLIAVSDDADDRGRRPPTRDRSHRP